nr:FtsX-like permease family protein [Bifidobacterium aesculapii]
MIGGHVRGGSRRSSAPSGAGVSAAFVKDTLRCWLRGWKRFVSIAVITLLGVAVLTGIYAGCRDMFRAADRFYDAQGLHDIQVLSTYGLTDADVIALRRVDGVAKVQPERTQSVTTEIDGTDKTVTMREIGTEGLDRPHLTDGRIPRKAGEIAVTRTFLKDSGLKLGSRLTVTPEEADTADALASDGSVDSASDGSVSGDTTSDDTAEQAPAFPTDLTIVGEVLDPTDLSNPDGIGTEAFRRSATSDYTFFAPSAGVTGNVYTAISLTVKGAADEDTFGDDYDAIVGEVATRIENTVQNAQQQSRRQTIVNRAQRAFDTAKSDAETKLDDAQHQIDDQKAQLDNGRQQLKDAKRNLEDQQVTLENNAERLEEGRDQLNTGLTQARNGQAQLQQGLATAQTMRDVAEQAASAADQAKAAADQAVTDAREAGASDAALAPLEQAAKQAGDTAVRLRSQADESAAQVNGLQAQLDQINATIAQLETQSAQLSTQAEQIRTGRVQIRDGFKQIDDQQTQLDEGAAQLEQAQKDLDAQRKTATTRFATQQQRIDDIAAARWYVQTRSSIDGYSALDSDVSSIESIGRAFPVVFLLVAVLMSLTTMTRMVEEDRGLIGTYTGLGYGPVAIAMRYVLFAVLACLIGGGLGLVAGFVGIPAFLLVVLEGLYTIPGIRLEYDWLYGSAGIALFVAGILIATIAACAGELRQTPAALIRPKAPKAGTRVLLERIPPVWRHMSFLNKVTARNIARFKSRLVMTVGGVAGCTALIVCGLAINDSVATLGVKQYEDITRYSLMVVAGDSDADAMRERVDEDGRATSTLDLRVESGELDADDSSESVELLVVPNKDAGRLDDMIALRDATGDHEELTLGAAGGTADGSASGASGGVIVDQSAANALGVKAGDTVTLHDANMRIGEAKVAAVSRNLIGSNVYMTETQYRNTFGVNADADVTLNARLAMLDGTADENIAYADKLARDPSVLSAVSTDKLERSFQFELMAAVVALIVGLAGGLALVVLFTLANTNVSERVREMATLKVLGFFDREVHLYVNKEMMILTVAGILVGLPLGRWVGGLLTAALAMPGMYFEVEVRPVSYLIAAAVTLAFTLLVQLLTNPVLDRIDPVGALKSVE